MSTNLFTHLASGQLAPVDQISIETVKDDDNGTPISIIITWPSRLTVVRPQDFPETATRVALLLGEAQARLAAIAQDHLSQPRPSARLDHGEAVSLVGAPGAVSLLLSSPVLINSSCSYPVLPICPVSSGLCPQQRCASCGRHDRLSLAPGNSPRLLHWP